MQRKNRLAVFEHVPPKERPNSTKIGKSLKRLRSPEPSFEDNLAQRSVKRRRKNIKTAEGELIYNCQYEECNYSTNKYYDLLKHLEHHAREQEDSQDSDKICMWEHCEEILENDNLLKQHIIYHGYHVKLKAIGANMLTKLKLPECSEVCDFRVPSLPSSYTCEWDFCDNKFKNYQVFIDHIKCHVNSTPKKCVKKDDIIQCGWTGCLNTYPTQYKLLEHVRSHTKEKVIACPSCGVMFSSRTKFYDHRKRQLSMDMQGYQCSQCSKLFASERLLRDHMRIHINHYKCHLCDMTCPKPSSLAKHIRYRHLPDRLFKCNICNHSTITKQDLTNHKETHINENKLACLVCDFKCRSKYTLTRHLQIHDGTWDYKYACHCCDKRFARGALLTKHLIKVHDFHWPSGHSRFSYKQDNKTGLYHLQVVRYESLEVTQEMMQGNIPYQFEKGQNCNFECEQSANKPLSYVLKLSNNKERKNDDLINLKVQSSKCLKKEEPRNNDDVLITIEEVDSKGNIVKIEAVESTKIIYASDVHAENYELIN